MCAQCQCIMLPSVLAASLYLNVDLSVRELSSISVADQTTLLLRIKTAVFIVVAITPLFKSPNKKT